MYFTKLITTKLFTMRSQRDFSISISQIGKKTYLLLLFCNNLNKKKLQTENIEKSFCGNIVNDVIIINQVKQFFFQVYSSLITIWNTKIHVFYIVHYEQTKTESVTLTSPYYNQKQLYLLLGYVNLHILCSIL